jgi:hypothetical protein
MLRLSTLPLVAALAACSPKSTPGPIAPEFGSLEPSSWVNGAPMSLAGARGSVVLIEAWEQF